MSEPRSVPMTDGSPRRRRLRAPGRPAVWVAGVGLGVGLVGIVTLPLPGPAPSAGSPPRFSPLPDAPATTARRPVAPPTVPGEVGEPPAATVGPADTTLPPRPPGLRLDPAALAGRYVSEWLTYPPGAEPAAALATRLDDLVTPRYLTVVGGLSTAGTEDRPGSVAVPGATTLLEDGGTGRTYRVTAWQAQYGTGGADTLVGPDSWDVTLVQATGGWLVDGLRRVG